MSAVTAPILKPTFLAWDSQFFDLKVGRVSLSSADARYLHEILETAVEEYYDLLYVLADGAVTLPDTMLKRHNGLFVDRKIVYEQPLMPGSVTTASVRLATADDKHQLYPLAYQSGEYSRFRVDPRIGEVNFQRLYRQWVDKSVSGDMADAVFVLPSQNAVTGFVTVKIDSDTGTIGLIASDIQYRGQGIGSALINQVKAYAAESGVNRLDVVTQGHNIPACRFYEKNQFTVNNETNVYHFWL